MFPWATAHMVIFSWPINIPLKGPHFLQQLNFSSEPQLGRGEWTAGGCLEVFCWRVEKAYIQMKQTQIILPLQQRVITENPFPKAAGSQEPFTSHSYMRPGTPLLVPPLMTEWSHVHTEII